MNTKDLLELLHGKLTEKLLTLLDQDELPASILKEAREFLKDNGIEARATPNSPLEKLSTRVPFPEHDDATH